MKFINKKGFTLIELVVSTFIIALLMGIFLTDYHYTNKEAQVDLFTKELAATIREAQNNALSSFESAVVAGSGDLWGVRISSDSYTIFVDVDEDYLFDSGETKRTKNFPNNITSNITGTEDLTFKSPNADFRVNGLADATQIILSSGSYSRTIDINEFGLIESSR